MHIADALSRAFIVDTAEECEIMQFRRNLETVNMMDSLPVSRGIIQEMQHNVSKDSGMQQLRRTIIEGWPSENTTLPESVKPYFQIREELTVSDGLIFRGHRVVVPPLQRASMLRTIHSSQCGVNACRRRARDSLYWPSMNAQIKDFITTCEICRSIDMKQQKETLHLHEVPDRRWAKVAVDLFV